MSKSTSGRRVRDRSEATELLDEWKNSGERMSEWCAARGINWYSLNAHRGHRERGMMRMNEFVELTVAEPVVSAPAAMARYRLCVGDYTLEVEDDFRDDSVRRLLHLAATC